MILSEMTASPPFVQTVSLVALFVALAGFVAVVGYLLLRRNRIAFDNARWMPLGDGVLGDGVLGDDAPCLAQRRDGGSALGDRSAVQVTQTVDTPAVRER